MDAAKLHAARHTAGTMLIASGSDISVVQEVLGHTDIKTTRIYVNSQELHPMGEFSQVA